MPTTATGKLDAKLLHAIPAGMSADHLRQYAASQRQPFAEPTNETEAQLRTLFAQALGCDESEIGIDDSLRQLGGDSLKVVTLQGSIKRHFGKALSVQFINSRGRCIRTLAPHVLDHNDGTSAVPPPAYQEDDLGKVFETCVQQVWPADKQWEKEESTSSWIDSTLRPGAHVLVTGGTGYLGSAIMRHVLDNADIGKVSVLVRASSSDAALQRVVRSATIAGWWSDRYLPKLNIWKGDLGMRGFGLARDQWKALNGQLSSATENVDAIIHNGAAVDWSSDFAGLKPVNVDSTLQLIRIAFASPAHPKLVYVSGGGLVDHAPSQTTQDRIDAARSLASHGLGYSQTKVLSELVVSECASRLPAHQTLLSTVKPGRIIGTPEQGIANTDDLIWRIVSAAVSLQAYPQEPAENRMLVADTDVIVSRITGQLSSSASNSFSAYAPVTSDISIPDFWHVLADVLAQAGLTLKPVSWEEWLSLAQADLEAKKESHVLWPVQNFLGGLGVYSESNGPRDDGASSKRVEAALRRNAEYLLDTGFLHVPGREKKDMNGDVFKRSGL